LSLPTKPALRTRRLGRKQVLDVTAERRRLTKAGATLGWFLTWSATSLRRFARTSRDFDFALRKAPVSVSKVSKGDVAAVCHLRLLYHRMIRLNGVRPNWLVCCISRILLWLPPSSQSTTKSYIVTFHPPRCETSGGRSL